MEIKIQATLKGEAAEKFVTSMERNHRTRAAEAVYRIEQSLRSESGKED